MMLRMAGIACLLVGTVVIAVGADKPPASQPTPMQKFPDTGGWSPEALECLGQMRNVGQAATLHAMRHDGQLPADPGPTLAVVDRWSAMGRDDHRHATPAEKVAMYICPADRKGKELPVNPTPEWIVANTSYVYLGADAILSQIPDEKWGTTVLLHGRHPEMEGVVGAVMLDGHGDGMTKEELAKAVEASKKTFEAARGKP